MCFHGASIAVKGDTMKAATKRITKRVVDAAKPTAKEQFIWDADLSGFGLRVMPSGVKAYVTLSNRISGGNA